MTWSDGDYFENLTKIYVWIAGVFAVATRHVKTTSLKRKRIKKRLVATTRILA